MRVAIERHAPTATVRVYVLQDGTGGGGYQWEPDHGWNIEVKPGAEMQPSLVFPRDVWEAIASAALAEPDGSAPVKDAVADAREVRDRLLTLVESAFPALVIAPREENR